MDRKGLGRQKETTLARVAIPHRIRDAALVPRTGAPGTSPLVRLPSPRGKEYRGCAPGGFVMITTRLRGAILLVVSCLAFGCGDDNPAAPATQEVTGAWRATKVEYVGSGALGAYDLVADGAEIGLLLSADGTFRYTVTRPMANPQATDGTWNLGSDTMTLSPDGVPFAWQFDCTMASDVLKLTGADAEWDFNDDGTPEPAKLNLDLVR